MAPADVGTGSGPLALSHPQRVSPPFERGACLPHLELHQAAGRAGGRQHVGRAHILRSKLARLAGQRLQLLRVDGVHVLPAGGEVRKSGGHPRGRTRASCPPLPATRASLLAGCSCRRTPPSPSAQCAAPVCIETGGQDAVVSGQRTLAGGHQAAELVLGARARPDSGQELHKLAV